MKTLFVFTLFLAIAALQLQGQWTTNTKLNTPVTDTNGRMGNTKIVLDEVSGNGYISWDGYYNQDYQFQFMLTRINKDGEKVWGNANLVVGNHPTTTSNTFYGMISDDDSCAVLINRDERTGYSNAYAWRISSNGEFLWGADGLAMTQNIAPDVTIMGMNVTQIQDGNYIFAWTVEQFSSASAKGGALKTWICLQKVSKDMTFLWSQPLILENDSISCLLRDYPITPTHDGGFTILFQGITRVPAQGEVDKEYSNLYLQHFDQDGVPLWPKPVTLDQDDVLPLLPVQAQLIPDSNDNITVLWTSAAGFLAHIKIQRIDSDGNILFGTYGNYVLDNAYPQDLFTGTFHPPDQSTTVYWDEYEPEGVVRFRIMAQRLSATGEPLWGDQGKELLPFVADTIFLPSQAAALPDGSSLMIWSKRLVNAQGNVIYAMRVDSTGSFVWDPPFTILSDTLSAKHDLSLSSFTNGEAVLVWGDARKDTTGGLYEISDIMAQNILETGKTGPLSIQDPAPLERNTLFLYPNPAISGIPVEVRFNGEPGVRVVVCDALGHPVSLSPDVARCAHGPCTALIQTSGMKPGLYTIVITSASQTAAGKLIIW